MSERNSHVRFFEEGLIKFLDEMDIEDARLKSCVAHNEHHAEIFSEMEALVAQAVGRGEITDWQADMIIEDCHQAVEDGLFDNPELV